MSDTVAARRRQRDASLAGEHRPGKKDARADLRRQLRIETRRAQLLRLDRDGSRGGVPLDGRAETRRAFQHARHVRDVRHILERDRLRGEKRRGDHRKRRILVSRHAVDTADRPPS